MFSSLQKMSEQWETSYKKSPTVLESDARKEMARWPGLITFFRADKNMILRWMSTGADNKKLSGVDLRTLVNKDYFLRAQKSGLPQVTAVKDFNFIQGRGFLLVFPLKAEGHFDGLLIVRFDTDIFFNRLLNRALSQRNNICITEEEATVFNNNPDNTSLAEDNPWELRNKIAWSMKEWEIVVAPKPSFLKAQHSRAPVYILVAWLAASVLVSALAFLLLRNRYAGLIRRFEAFSLDNFFSKNTRTRNEFLLRKNVFSRSNLKVRLILGASIFFLMIQLTWYNAYNSAQKDIDFTAREKEGIMTQRLLFDALYYTNLLRFDLILLRAGMPVNDEISAYIAKVEDRLDHLESTDYIDLRRQWRGLRQEIKRDQHLLYNDTGLVSLIINIRKEIVQTGDTSNLILDSHLDSYYLASVLLSKLPENQTRLSEMALFVYPKISGDTSFSDSERVRAANIG